MQMTINVPYSLTGLRMHADILMHCTDINIHTTCIELYDLLSPLIVTAPYSLMTINVPYSLTGLKMHADILINCTDINFHITCCMIEGKNNKTHKKVLLVCDTVNKYITMYLQIIIYIS